MLPSRSDCERQVHLEHTLRTLWLHIRHTLRTPWPNLGYNLGPHWVTMGIAKVILGYASCHLGGGVPSGLLGTYWGHLEHTMGTPWVHVSPWVHFGPPWASSWLQLGYTSSPHLGTPWVHLRTNFGPTWVHALSSSVHLGRILGAGFMGIIQGTKSLRMHPGHPSSPKMPNRNHIWTFPTNHVSRNKATRPPPLVPSPKRS